MSKKKLFYVNDDKDKPITSGGVIIYRFIKNNMELLLSDTRNNYEDLGGMIDEKDKDILSTIAREAFEESNNLLKKTTIKTRLKKSNYIYVPKCKYIIYIIKANSLEEKLSSLDFGDKEIHDNIDRKIKWIPLDIFLLPETIKYKLNWRLKSKLLYDKLKEIKNDVKLDINMFSSSQVDEENEVKIVKPAKKVITK
jgi:hypothetical protein